MEAQWLNLGVSGVGLIISVALLVEALLVRKVTLGGAIAEKISYVLLAIVCLCAAALAAWTSNFVRGLTLSQIRLAQQLLDIAAMGLLAAYFRSIRTAMQRYLKAITGSQHLAAEMEAESDGLPGGPGAGSSGEGEA